MIDEIDREVMVVAVSKKCFVSRVRGHTNLVDLGTSLGTVQYALESSNLLRLRSGL